MKKNVILALFFGLALGALAAYASQPIQFVPGVTYDFANCATDGGAAQTLHSGPYVMTVTDEDVWLCWAATCPQGSGRRFPVGTVMLVGFGLGSGADTQLSCNSTGATGDLGFTRAN